MNLIADELVRRGVCDWVPLSSVVQFRGQAVLNGLFGVEKSATVDSGLPVLRLIMNLIPINSGHYETIYRCCQTSPINNLLDECGFGRESGNSNLAVRHVQCILSLSIARYLETLPCLQCTSEISASRGT